MTHTDTSYIPANFIDHEEILGELTNMYEARMVAEEAYRESLRRISTLRNELEEFVRANYDESDASKLIRDLVEQFALDVTRQVRATISLSFEVNVEAPLSMSLERIKHQMESFDPVLNEGFTDFDSMTYDLCTYDVMDMEEM